MTPRLLYIEKISFFSVLFLITIALTSCRSLPKEKYSQFDIKASYEFVGGELQLKVNNELHCPIRIYGRTKDQLLDSIFARLNPITIPERVDSLILIEIGQDIEPRVNFRITLGDPKKEIKKSPIVYPFPTGKSYEIIQGNNSRPTHNTNYSRYAVDFALQINDTITSATNGYVVGVIKDYKYGGEGSKWRPYSNYITIYDSKTGVFLQYVHLVHQGSFVKVGDEVRVGQPIGLSGKTGQTNIEHLHFNYMIPTENRDGIQSSPFDFEDGRKSTSLKRGELVQRTD